MNNGQRNSTNAVPEPWDVAWVSENEWGAKPFEPFDKAPYRTVPGTNGFPVPSIGSELTATDSRGFCLEGRYVRTVQYADSSKID